jgi:hypothetical protein
MNSTISSYRSACSASFAMYTFSSRAVGEDATAIVDSIREQTQRENENERLDLGRERNGESERERDMCGFACVVLILF